MARDVVLVVRETASLADSVEELLTSEGYRVRTVPNAHEGRRLLSSPRGREVRATVIVCNEAVCSGLATMASVESETPLIVLGWRGPPFVPRGNTKLLLLRLPTSAGVLLESLRALVHGDAPHGTPVAG